MAPSPFKATPATTLFTTWAPTILRENTAFWKPLHSSNATATSQPDRCLTRTINRCDARSVIFVAGATRDRQGATKPAAYPATDSGAIAYLKAFRNEEMTHAAERDAFDQAIELIRRGGFQNQPNNINKLQRKIRKKSIAPAQQLHALLRIINKYLPPENP